MSVSTQKDWHSALDIQTEENSKLVAQIHNLHGQVATLQRELAEAKADAAAEQAEAQRMLDSRDEEITEAKAESERLKDNYQTILDSHVLVTNERNEARAQVLALQSWQESVLAEVGDVPCAMPIEPADIYHQYQCAIRRSSYFQNRSEHLAAKLVESNRLLRLWLQDFGSSTDLSYDTRTAIAGQPDHIANAGKMVDAAKPRTLTHLERDVLDRALMASVEVVPAPKLERICDHGDWVTCPSCAATKPQCQHDLCEPEPTLRLVEGQADYTVIECTVCNQRWTNPVKLVDEPAPKGGERCESYSPLHGTRLCFHCGKHQLEHPDPSSPKLSGEQS